MGFMEFNLRAGQNETENRVTSIRGFSRSEADHFRIWPAAARLLGVTMGPNLSLLNQIHLQSYKNSEERAVTRKSGEMNPNLNSHMGVGTILRVRGWTRHGSKSKLRSSEK